MTRTYRRSPEMTGLVEGPFGIPPVTDFEIRNVCPTRFAAEWSRGAGRASAKAAAERMASKAAVTRAARGIGLETVGRRRVAAARRVYV